MEYQSEITINQLFPNLSEEDLEVAEENLRAYLALALRIYQWLEREGKLAVLTERKLEHRFKAKVES